MRIFRTFIMFFLMTMLLFTSGCGTTIDVAEVIGTDKMDIQYGYGSFVIDDSNITEITTYSSYVFVAEVMSYDETYYLDEAGESPVTVYSVRVKHNIKGSLRMDEDIKLHKNGGLIQNTNSFFLYDGDILPKPGKTYLFAASFLKEELYCFAPNMTVEITDNFDDLENNEIVKKYAEACLTEAEGIENGNTKKSKYDDGEVK